MIISVSAMAQGGNTQNASGWKVVGNEVQLQDTNLRVNMGNHIATEKTDISGNIRVREMTDLPQNNAANAQLKFRSIFADNEGRFFRGPERHLPELPHVVGNPPVPSLGWQLNGTNIVWTNKLVGINTNNPGAGFNLDVSGTIHATNKVLASAFASNSPFIIEAPAGVERARIDEFTGYFGIGTTIPFSKLHIENNGNVRITLKDASHPAGKYFQIEQDKDIVSFNDDGVKQIMSMSLTSGNVGIGTSSPSTTLDVRGSGKDIIHITAPLTSDRAGIRFFRTDNSDVSYIYYENYGTSGTATNMNRLVLESGDDGDQDYILFRNLHWSAGAKDVMAVHRDKVTVDAKVGIGTTNPSGLLHLSGENQATLILEDRDEAVNDKKWCIRHAVDAPGHLQFQSLNDDNTVRTKAMSLSPAGNVGIGAINPAHILTVKKDQPAYTYIVADNVYSPASAGVGSGFAMAENNLITWYLRSERDGSGRFNIGNLLGNQLTIQDNGNVGIGTTNPQTKLDVIGIIRACEAKVNLASGQCPDFVFENTYDLFSLKKRKEIVFKNKRLLYIGSGKELEKNGLALGEFSMGLLQNVEEHERYLYEHDEKINLLMQKVEKLENENKELKKKLNKIQTIKK